MIAKGKMFIVANNVDDSIRSATPIYDITVYHKFTEFEKFIYDTPIVIDCIVISERDLPFTSSNIQRLIELLNQPFLKVTDAVLYLIDNDTSLETVREFLTNYPDYNIKCYQGDLTSRYIAEIINGVGRDSDESEVEVVTYRMRASEYAMDQTIKKYESDDSEHYNTDEDLLNGIPEEPEPVVNIPSATTDMYVYYVVGEMGQSRSLFAFTEAQYLSVTQKVLLIEPDSEYHRLTDIVLKSGVEVDYYDMTDFLSDATGVLDRVKLSNSNLILFGCKDRIKYDYDFVMSIVTSNLSGYIDAVIKECGYDSVPVSMYYNIVCENTVPDILKCCTSLKFAVDAKKVVFVSVRYGAWTNICVTTEEAREIVNTVLDHEDIIVQVVEFNGLVLSDEQIVYDVFGLIGRGNVLQLE